MINHLVSDGSFIPAGLSDSGEKMYVITDKCKELHPEVWNKYFDEFQGTVNALYILGYINYDDNGNINPTEYAFSEDITKLPDKLFRTMEAVILSQMEHGV